MTIYRNTPNVDRVKNIVLENKNNLFFITFDEDEYNHFIDKYEIDRNNINLYLLKSLNELCVILNSCKYAYLGVSSFAVICNGLHKKHSIFSCDDNFGNFTNNMVDVLPHVLEFI